MNKGESDELLAVIRLAQIRDAGGSLPVFGQVRSVGFKEQEYGSPPWPHDSGEPNIHLPKSTLVSASLSMGFQKAGRDDKADVYINGLGVSLKSMRSAPPAIVNHTARHGWARICQQIGHDISELDLIIDHYWELRQSGIIKEDTVNSDTESPFRAHLEYIKPLLSYFLFQGTGARETKSPAAYLIDFANPLRETTWEVFSPDGIVEHLWPRLVFSLRSKKGMPPSYPNMNDTAKRDSIARWTKLHQNQYRGALHVRVK